MTISAEQGYLQQLVRQAGLLEPPPDPEQIPFTENAHAVLARRYLVKDESGQPAESPDDMLQRVAQNLAQAEANYGATAGEQEQQANEMFSLMRSLEFLPNSPTLMNAGRELQQLSACFVIPVQDSLDSIFNAVLQTAMIHKSGGGTGFSFARLRPEGDPVGSTGGVASGPVSFISAFDSATDVVKQGGTRRGANMGILNVEHPDIMKFISAKRDGARLQNFNISVGVNAEFMERARTGADYDLIHPRTQAVVGQLNARQVFEQIVDNAWATGDPGLVFLDRINADNPNPQLGPIESTNPCGEAPLSPYESCNLGSINVARMLTPEGRIDQHRLQGVCAQAVRLLDNVIDVNRFPLPEIADISRKTRRIGVGVMGFADLLILLGLPYDSPAAQQFASELMGTIHSWVHQASQRLAETRGPFPAFAESAYRDRTPMRNSAPVTIAPTGTISIIAGASSGIEPLFALAYVRNVMDRTRLVETNPYLERILEVAGVEDPDLPERIARTGSIETETELIWPEIRELFKTSSQIRPADHVRMQAAFQQNTDNAVSKTINFPATATPDDVAAAYRLATDLGCKGITIYRDGSKEQQVLTAGNPGQQVPDPDLEPNPNPNEIPAPKRPGVGVSPSRQAAGNPTARRRPRKIHGVTERIGTGHGTAYITVNYDEDQQPFEVFTTLGKAGSCDAAQLEAISRLASLALRAGIQPEEIASQLSGITCCPRWDQGIQVKSTPDALAQVLRRRAGLDPEIPPEPDQLQLQLPLPPMQNGNRPEPEPQTATPRRRETCPECHGDTINTEGCRSCPGCGWNRCE